MDRHLGTRNFDDILFKKYAEIFEQKTGLSVYENKKSILRLQDAIEK